MSQMEQVYHLESIQNPFPQQRPDISLFDSLYREDLNKH